MSKSDWPFEYINREAVYKPPKTAKWTGDKPINGFDTETAGGRVFMLTRALDGRNAESIDNDGDWVQPEQIWNTLTHKKARSAVNVWYNLDFDADAMLSHMLTPEEKARLVIGVDIEIGDWTMAYIPGKFLSLRDGNGNKYVHYDVSQFFYAPLDDAAEQWLGENKDDIDTSKFGKHPDEDRPNDHIMNNWFEIRKYARRDARLTRDLWKRAVEVGEGNGIPMGEPFSTGYMAELYLRENMPQKPGVGPSAMQSLAWDGMKGGRFETFKRGYVGDVVGADINSAYPAVISRLPEPSTLTWELTPSPSLSGIREADWGFLDITVTTEDAKIQPFGVKNTDSAPDGHPKDKLYYPRLIDGDTTVTRETFLFAHRQGLIESFEVNKAALGHETQSTTFPWRDWIDIPDLYENRKEYENRDMDGGYNPKVGLLIKIVLNSMYGKTAQTTLKRGFPPTDRPLKKHEKYVPALSLPKYIRDEYKEGFIEWLEAGRWFNPFISSYITAETRRMLHSAVLEYGLEDATVMFATDCIMVEADAYHDTDFHEDLVRFGLGNWDYDYEGRAFVIGSGVYEVAMPGGLKTATRGFSEKELDRGLWHAAMQSDDDKIRMENLRPKTMAEAVWLDSGDPADIGKFLKFPDSVAADFDDKRSWENATPTFEDLLSGVEGSEPLELDK